MKPCSVCKISKPLHEFSRDASRPDGMRYYCRQCNKAYRAANAEARRETAKRWRQRNVQHIRDSGLKAKFGIGLAEVERMMQAQDNRCAICISELGVPFVDHCHASGKIRGLLCRLCNLGLGHFCDSVASLRNAVKYLKGVSK